MTNRPLQEEANGPMTEKQRQKNKKGRRFATYAVYNTSHETIILPKNQIVGRCQLILQPNEGAYLQEMSAMQKEGAAEKEVEERSKKRNGDVDSEETQEELSREWVIENFWLQDNPIIKNNPEVGKELIRVLQKKGRAFEGGAKRDQVIGQGVAGRTDWIVARVELKPGEETPELLFT